jgi:hypothetical protein
MQCYVLGDDAVVFRELSSGEIMTVEQQQGWKFNRMVHAIVKGQWQWPVDTDPFVLPWEGGYWGFTIPRAAVDLTADRLQWLWQNDCIAQVDRERIILGPQVPVMPPEFCFHTTPSENVDSIMEKGLLTGAEAGRSTSQRSDCAHHIYVTFDHNSAKTWTEENRFGGLNPGKDWGILKIDSSGITQRLLRDPCSIDGYILEAKRVEQVYLELVERIGRK